MAAHHLNTSPQPLRERVPSLSREVETVVMRALAKEPAERFPNIQAFAQALEDASIAKTAPPHSSMSTSPTPVVVSPSLPSMIAPSAQIATSQINPWDTIAVSSSTTIAQSITVRSNHISRRAMTAALGGVVGLSMIAGGTAWFTLAHMQSLPSVTPKVKPQSPALIPSYPVGTTLATYSQHTDKVTGVTWSPDERWIASSSDDKTVHVWPAAEHVQGTPLTYTSHTDGVLAVEWSPNGQYLASASKDKTVRVWYAPGTRIGTPGNTLAVYSESSTDIPALAWSPDSKRIASTKEYEAVYVWDAETGKHTLDYPDPTQNGPSPTSGPANSVAWSHNSLYMVSSIITVAVWDTTNANRILTYPGHGFTVVHGLAWSPDSERVASAGEDKTVQVWNATTGETLLTYKGHVDAVNAVAWSPDGKYLASASRDKTGMGCSNRQTCFDL
jgi:WD40 repeat protein